MGTVAYISNGVEHASAVQYGITDCARQSHTTREDNHVPDKKSGRPRGADGMRRGALAGFYGTCPVEALGLKGTCQ